VEGSDRRQGHSTRLAVWLVVNCDAEWEGSGRHVGRQCRLQVPFNVQYFARYLVKRRLSKEYIREFNTLLADGPFIADDHIDTVDGLQLAPGSEGYLSGGVAYSSIHAAEDAGEYVDWNQI
jgi:hypothetical protein